MGQLCLVIIGHSHAIDPQAKIDLEEHLFSNCVFAVCSSPVSSCISTILWPLLRDSITPKSKHLACISTILHSNSFYWLKWGLCLLNHSGNSLQFALYMDFHCSVFGQSELYSKVLSKRRHENWKQNMCGFDTIFQKH